MDLLTLLLSVLLVAGTCLATGLLVTAGLFGMARLERVAVTPPAGRRRTVQQRTRRHLTGRRR
jgi:hypothetical protein